MIDEIAKEMENLAERFPEKEPADRAYDASRLVLSCFPNGLPLEILSLLITPSLVRRKDEWLKELASVVDEIGRRTEGFDIRRLQDNEQFVSAVVIATRIATSTHQSEKRKLLRNALVRIGTNCNLEEDLRFSFLRLIEEFSPTHVRVLEFLWRGASKLAAMNGGQLPPSNRYQELANNALGFCAQGEFVDLILRDLRNRALCRAETITSGIDTQLTTNLGINFLGFVLDPEESK